MHKNEKINDVSLVISKKFNAANVKNLRAMPCSYKYSRIGLKMKEIFK